MNNALHAHPAKRVRRFDMYSMSSLVNAPPLRQGGATGPRGQEAGVRISTDIRQVSESKRNEREVKRWRRGFLRERFLGAERTEEFPEGGEAGRDVNLLGK